MSTGLLEQLADYGVYHDEIQGSIDVADIVGGTRPDSVPEEKVVRRSRSIPVGLLTAAAASLTVLVLVGGAVLLTRWSVDDRPPVTDPAATIDASVTTPSPPTTNPAPSTTLPGADFAPRLEGSGVDVTFDVTPRAMTISGENFVVMEAEWTIDWVGMAWEWGDDEVRQQIAAGYEGNQTKWQAATRTLVIQRNADKPTGEDLIARFALTYSGTSDDFEIQAYDESSGERLAGVTGSLPGLSEEQILAKVARNPSFAPGRAGWFFASDNGELRPLDPPWEPFWGQGNQFLEVGELTLALFATDAGWNLWSTTDGYAWEDLGEPSWPDLAGSGIFVHEDRLYEHGWTRDAQGYLQQLEFWTSSDGVEWTELTQAEYEAATGLTIPTANPEDVPPPPDNAPATGDLLAAVNSYFDEVSRDAVVVSTNPLILQLRPGPEPNFDTSGLGEEIPFEPLDPDDPRAVWLVDRLADGAGDPGPQPEGPVLFVGRVSDSVMALPSTDMDIYDGWDLLFATDCGYECLGIEALKAAGETSDDIWIADLHQGSGGRIAVPLDTAVVALRYNADTALWQRPTGGWAIFPTSVDGDDTYWVDAYDADGNLIATTEQR